MPSIKQFRFGADNLGYLIYGTRDAVAIDGGAADLMLAFIQSQELKLAMLTNTHNHPDHTPGNHRLIAATGARLMKSSVFTDSENIPLEDERITVYKTPGHSLDSVCFHTGSFLITGDTLFNGTVGNCFTGDLKGFYQSIKKLMTFPEETVIYAGHDYVADSLAYAAALEPDNTFIRQFMARYSPGHVFSTLRDELQINPFLRMNAPEIVAVLKKHGLPCGTEWDRWHSLMTMD